MNSNTISFGEALALLRLGKNVTRDSWDGAEMHLNVQITTVSKSGARIPWVPSHADLLASDWHEVVGQSDTVSDSDTHAEQSKNPSNSSSADQTV